MTNRDASREAMEYFYTTAKNDIKDMINNVAFGYDNKFKVNMLCSIFSEYALHLKKKDIAYSDIQKHILEQTKLLKENAPEYCSMNFTSPIVEAVKNTLYGTEVKSIIKNKFFKNSGSTIKKAFTDIDLNDAVRGVESLEIHNPTNIHSVAFCDHYFEDCVAVLKKNCEIDQSFMNYLV